MKCPLVLTYALCLMLMCMFTSSAHAETHFFEAESFVIQDDGWKINTGPQARPASRAAALNGASGEGNSIASKEFTVTDGGPWRVHVRHMYHEKYKGPFVISIKLHNKTIATRTFDQKPFPNTRSWDYVWDSLDTILKPGTYTVELSKFENKNATSYARNIDALLITNDLKLQPDITPYGPQTWMRVTLKDGHGGPVQIHIFADHYRRPWYAHYAVSKDGMEDGLRPKRNDARLVDGETTGWVNISRAIYHDSGARLMIYPAITYHQHAERFNATIDMASAPSDDAIVKTFEIDQTPSTLQMIVPGNLESPEAIAQLKIDREFAFAIGEIADQFDWPTLGKKPLKFPFFISAALNPANMSSQVLQREHKTLDYFGFNNIGKAGEQTGFTTIGNVGWYYKGTYSNPDIKRMTTRAPKLRENQLAEGIKKENIVLAMVMDEPTGRPVSTFVKDEPSINAFVDWIKRQKLTPADLLVNSWNDVKPVLETEADKFPALHYYTQQFRTVQLGDFIAIQKKILHENWDANFPVNVNFSDGAVYYANFYGQAVDYFTLLRETNQNAIWSEDWANRSSSYQCASYNVELMRGAARDGNYHMGQHLIVYAGRTGNDIRLKAVSEAARGIKMFKSYAYGPVWAGHDKSAWQQHTRLWTDHATLLREIGAVEDFLMPAMPRQAQVALLYSSASDIWSINDNSHGFNRMHTWMALAHAHIPVDIVHEKQIENDALKDYKVVYFSGTNITGAAAVKLKAWVEAGGTLILTAGAGMKDEYNRPLDTLDQVLPYTRNELQTLQPYGYGGRDLVNLLPQDIVTQNNTKLEVLGVKQTFTQKKLGARMPMLATFSDGSIAAFQCSVGKGTIIAQGFLPALDYIKKALVAKSKFIALDAGETDVAEEDGGIPGREAIHEILPNEKSYNPWDYPADVRKLITTPVDQAVAVKKVTLPLTCSVPLVDAVYMVCDQGVLVPLANYTLEPVEEMTLDIAVDNPVKEVRSVHQGVLKVTQVNDKLIRVTLPLDCTDFVTVAY